jgi:hypothetical protein
MQKRCATSAPGPDAALLLSVRLGFLRNLTRIWAPTLPLLGPVLATAAAIAAPDPQITGTLTPRPQASAGANSISQPLPRA